MPDYGHSLQFGTFITPVNSPPRRAVELAQLSEQLSFDLVTFQDHPYQPAFHDTWTLMSWVAASTERVHISANVHNLPLRQPAVLARSVASLDLLSGGRIELALGAGGFWDAIEAMGGRRLTAGESVGALAEAIDIMPRHLGSCRPECVARRGGVLPSGGGEARPCPGASGADLVGRIQAANVATNRQQGRRLVAIAGVHEAG